MPEANPFSELPPRYLPVLRLVAHRYTNDEIATELHSARHTVEKYVSEMMAVTGLSPRSKLIVHALRWLDDMKGRGAFADMLGIPRIVNPDGSFVLPREYGAVGGDDNAAGGIKGLPDGFSGAIFDAEAVRPGAVIRFGPFFRSADTGFELAATGEDLHAGIEAEIGGEPHRITATVNEDGTTTVTFENIAEIPSVVATHPTSIVTVAIDGTPAEVFRGSTNFAKTLGYDVNANRSTIEVAGVIEPTSEVLIRSNSAGTVHRGQWDFPLD